MDNYLIPFLIYIAAISLLAAILTIIDKNKAKKNKWRIKENTLLFVGFLGGALSEYITMKLIRHKTLHKKFMIGLPVMVIFHIILISIILFV